MMRYVTLHASRNDGVVLSYSLFVVCEGSCAQSQLLAEHFREISARGPGVRKAGVSLDLFLPEPEGIHLFDDGPAPAAVLEFSSAEAASLQALVQDEVFQQHCVQIPASLHSGVSVTFCLFRSLPFPISGRDSIAPRRAGLSFLVRYYGPMPDERAFQDFYTANHPPILGRLPAVRNVFCYLPQEFYSAGLPLSEIKLINEVVFDDVEQLNAALRSDVVAALKADSAQFPPFGHSTHHAMRRDRLFGKAVD